MSKHTPGPWSAERCRGMTDAFDYYNITAGRLAVAEVEADSENGEANARLIASAPELLAALKDMCEVFDPYDPDSAQADACDRAAAAIAKAEGK